MIRRLRTIMSAVLTIAALVTVSFFGSDITDVADQAIELHLRLEAASLYDYQMRHGRWPARVDDLAQTSLPLQSPHWRTILQDGVNVIVWRNDLKPIPAQNADKILAYHNKGLRAKLGRVWVCWGDLRTEHIEAEKLRAHLAAVPR